MTDFDYKKYSLENLEKWVEDALSSAEASPQEIYDVIQKVVSENYYHHKHHASRAYELMEKLNGSVTFTSCDKDDPSPECKGAWNDFWEQYYYPEEVLNAMCDEAEKKDKVVKWRLPVQVDGLTGECYIQLPDDLLEVANLKEGDQVEWIDRKDGSFEMRKVDGTK
jgi:hypothetical protein